LVDVSVVRVGTAGWSLPRAAASRFPSTGRHLERYSQAFLCAEINSSFHRPHAAATYAKWRDSTPAGFRFAVKMPRLITHELKLQNGRQPLVDFLAQSGALEDKRGPILVQLPPKLSFDDGVVLPFFEMVRSVYEGPMVCEPRHPTWFTPSVSVVFERYRIARVAADPPPTPAAATPAGWEGMAYFRLHGAPRKYWSRYDEGYIESLVASLRALRVPREIWCVFDNTASGAAIENAWDLQRRLSDSGQWSGPAR
jgi:uncharacterized protein YecE (DUF72 family)